METVSLTIFKTKLHDEDSSTRFQEETYCHICILSGLKNGNCTES